MSETKNTHEDKTETEVTRPDTSPYFSERFTDERILYEIVRYLMTAPQVKPSDQIVHSAILQKLAGKFDEKTIRKAMDDVQNDLKTEEWKRQRYNKTTITFRITKEPITPQTIATTFTALTELYTKLWLIARHRYREAIAYTPNHVHLTSEAGITITQVTYNSPFLFGLQLDELFPKVANAIVTLVDGLSQRKAMAPLELEKRELENERLNIAAMKELQELNVMPLVSLRKELDNGIVLDYTARTIRIVDPTIRSDLLYICTDTITNSANQLDSIKGLQVVLPERSITQTLQEDTEQ
ncbi:MAG TPA: hypothetical protein VIX20_08195 [Ktedonobacteraceae bacterium]